MPVRSSTLSLTAFAVTPLSNGAIAHDTRWRLQNWSGTTLFVRAAASAPSNLEALKDGALAIPGNGSLSGEAATIADFWPSLGAGSFTLFGALENTGGPVSVDHA